MSVIITSVFLISVVGMFVAGALYFYFLFEFKSRLEAECNEGWSRFSANNVAGGLQLAYQALQQSKGGELAGVPLTKEIVSSRKLAVFFLYASMLFFMIVLMIGLLDSVSKGKY